jgi:hypothetical protein
MWNGVHWLPDSEDILKELIWAFSDFVRDPEAPYLAGNPGYPGSAEPFWKHGSAPSPAFVYSS